MVEMAADLDTEDRLTRPAAGGAGSIDRLITPPRVGDCWAHFQHVRRVPGTKMAAKHFAVLSASACVVGSLASVCHGQDGHVGARAFAIVLAQHGVPCGVVAPEGVMAWRRGDPQQEAVFRGVAPFVEGLASTLESFNARNGLIQASQRGGVVHLRSREEPSEVIALLERDHMIQADVAFPAEASLSFIATLLRDGEERGLIGTGRSPDADSLLRRPVHLRQGRASAIALFDEVVRQAPGLVWVATYNHGRPHEDLKLQMMEADRMTLTLSIDP
jgi:hypothetical protein